MIKGRATAQDGKACLDCLESVSEANLVLGVREDRSACINFGPVLVRERHEKFDAALVEMAQKSADIARLSALFAIIAQDEHEAERKPRAVGLTDEREELKSCAISVP